MELHFNIKLAQRYRSPSQKVRVLTEDWVASQIFCPSCGYTIRSYSHNKPVADFYCPNCNEEFELKSKKDTIGRKIVNGAYKTMIDRLLSRNNPNFFLLNYELKGIEVINFFVIPKYFFVPRVIEKRKPLSYRARRAGWTGCNILLYDIPQSGKIFYIRNKKIEKKRDVLTNWNKIVFLKDQKNNELKGWLLNIMNCIDRLNKKEFSLSDIYNFEKELESKYPNNRYIKDKIRQQLQFLRDKGYLEFIGRGKYRLT
ncbi:MAG: DpnI domain-containing protein [bacterium]